MNKAQQILVFKMLFRYLEMILVFLLAGSGDALYYDRIKEDRRVMFLEIEGK